MNHSPGNTWSTKDSPGFCSCRCQTPAISPTPAVEGFVFYKCKFKRWGGHLLSLPETQESHTEALEFQQDVVDGRVCVAGQQHAEPAGVKDANLGAEAEGREQGWGSLHRHRRHEAQACGSGRGGGVFRLPGCRWLWSCLCRASQRSGCSLWITAPSSWPVSAVC